MTPIGESGREPPPLHVGFSGRLSQPVMSADELTSDYLRLAG